MKKMSLTYEIEDIIISLIGPSMTPQHKPGQDKFSKKTEGYATKVTQLPNEAQPEQVELSDASDMDKNYE